MAPTIDVSLTEREAQVLIALIEVAGKQIGFEAWEGCLALRARVVQSLQRLNAEPAPEPPKPDPDPEPTR